jgi:tetratricopeptide (TPR) repeat protein
MALHKCRKRSVWLAAAGLAYGLAVGARPNLLFGAVILLVPVAQTWREQRKFWAPLLAATAPIVVIGLGLMLYNYLRFDSPFEFGLRYQLSGEQHFTQRFFSLGYLWFNFRVYFLAAAHWGGRFPFVHDITMPPLPAGHGGVDRPFGVLTNMPLVWLALAVPLGWRGRSAQARSAFCGFSTVLAALFGIAALMLGLYYTVACRYDLDFLPAFVLLAVTGILSVERTLVARPVWQRAARWGWSLLLGFSVVFGLLVSVARCAEHYRDLGAVFFQQGRLQEAVSHYQRALQIEPDYATAHNELGMALVRLGRLTEAIGHYEQALRIRPDFAEADNNLANALAWSDRLPEAVGHYERALRIKPDFAEAHNNLGVVLTRLGRRQEAIGHLEQALRIRPDYADARHNLEQAQAAQ